MKVVVGLGNPGEKYQNTRHNAGFEVVDVLARRLLADSLVQEQTDWKESKKGKLSYWWFDVEGEKVELVKPLTYMNLSGQAIAYVKKKHPELNSNDLFIAHDDLDIELGRCKVQFGKGPKGHKGVESVERELGSKEFWRVRVGVENRERQETRNKKQETDKIQITNNNAQTRNISGEKYVLMKFGEEERRVFDGVVEEVVDDLVGRLNVGAD